MEAGHTLHHAVISVGKAARRSEWGKTGRTGQTRGHSVLRSLSLSTGEADVEVLYLGRGEKLKQPGDPSPLVSTTAPPLPSGQRNILSPGAACSREPKVHDWDLEVVGSSPGVARTTSVQLLGP